MKKKKIFIIIFIAVIGLLCFSVYYISDYYHAEKEAFEILNQENIEVSDNYIKLNSSANSDKALIFYPGAKVEAEAYLPLLDQICQKGTTCILVRMPFNLAILNSNAADKIMNEFPDIRHWYIGGHSMGGAMASKFADKHSNEVDGLILLGAYIYGDYPDSNTLTIYGSLNQSVEDHINYEKNIIEIEGGNHAQFGNYGPQKGDLPATISTQEQQAIAAEAIDEFIN